MKSFNSFQVIKTGVRLTSLLILPSLPASAQTNTSANGSTTNTTSSHNDNYVREERGFPWGLLGLAGLFGLVSRGHKHEEASYSESNKTNPPT